MRISHSRECPDDAFERAKHGHVDRYGAYEGGHHTAPKDTSARLGVHLARRAPRRRAEAAHTRARARARARLQTRLENVEGDRRYPAEDTRRPSREEEWRHGRPRSN